MKIEKLVYMANQIGKFFEAQGEDEAVAGITDHIQKFWDPRMRNEITAHLKNGGDGLNPNALAALKQLEHNNKVSGDAKA